MTEFPLVMVDLFCQQEITTKVRLNLVGLVDREYIKVKKAYIKEDLRTIISMAKENKKNLMVIIIKDYFSTVKRL